MQWSGLRTANKFTSVVGIVRVSSERRPSGRCQVWITSIGTHWMLTLIFGAVESASRQHSKSLIKNCKKNGVLKKIPLEEGQNAKEGTWTIPQAHAAHWETSPLYAETKPIE